LPDAGPSSAPESEAPLLVVDHASKSFGAVRALEDGWIELHRRKDAGRVRAALMR